MIHSRVCWNWSSPLNPTVVIKALSKTLMLIPMFSGVSWLNVKKKSLSFTFQTLFRKYFFYNTKALKFKAVFGKATKKNPRVKKTPPVAIIWHGIGPGFFSLGFNYYLNIKLSLTSVAVFPEKIRSQSFYFTWWSIKDGSVLTRAQIVICLVIFKCT